MWRVGVKHYWFVLKRILVRHKNQECFAFIPILETIAESPILYLFCKTTYAQLPDIPLRSGTQALRLIARIPLIQRREKHRSREEKSAFTQCFFSVYARSLKDQARQSKYPRTQILDPRTQSTLFCHSSTNFIPTRSNNLIEVTSQSYIEISPKLYSFLRHPNIALPTYSY